MKWSIEEIIMSFKDALEKSRSNLTPDEARVYRATIEFLEELKKYRETGYTPEQVKELEEKHQSEFRPISQYIDKRKPHPENEPENKQEFLARLRDERITFIENEAYEKEDSTMEMPKVTVTDAVNILRTMAEHLMSVIVRTPHEEKKIRELAEDYMKIAKAVEDMEAAHLTECAQISQHEDEMRKQKNKRITIELPDGYDDALSITAFGREMSVNNELPNMMVRVTEVRVADLTGHDGDVLVIHPDEDCEWRKPVTEDAWAIMNLLFKTMNENGDATAAVQE